MYFSQYIFFFGGGDFWKTSLRLSLCVLWVLSIYEVATCRQNKKLVHLVTISVWKHIYFSRNTFDCYQQNSAEQLWYDGRYSIVWNVWFNSDVCSAVPIAVSSCLLYIITQYDLLYGLLLTALYTVYCMTHWIAVSWPVLTVLLICEILMTNWNVQYKWLWLFEKFW